MKKLPHEILGWEAIYDGSWKNSKFYQPPWHWKRKLFCFLGIHPPTYHIFDIRELFLREKDFCGDFDLPSYKKCFRRLLK